MANQISTNGTFTLNTGTVRSVGTAATTINLVGSNYVATVQNITSSGYVALDTSSLSDIRAGYFANNDSIGSVIVAMDNAGTKPIAVLWPDDSVIWTYSGSSAATPLYAIAVNTTGSVQLEYIISEA